jgi:hypothetical protein
MSFGRSLSSHTNSFFSDESYTSLSGFIASDNSFDYESGSTTENVNELVNCTGEQDGMSTDSSLSSFLKKELEKTNFVDTVSSWLNSSSFIRPHNIIVSDDEVNVATRKRKIIESSDSDSNSSNSVVFIKEVVGVKKDGALKNISPKKYLFFLVFLHVFSF